MDEQTNLQSKLLPEKYSAIDKHKKNKLSSVSYNVEIFQEGELVRVKEDKINNIHKLLQDKKFIPFKISEFFTSNSEYNSSILTYAIGYASIWRFPYYFLECNGAVFFIPFLLFIIIIGIPLMTVEFALGQIYQKGPTTIFFKLNKKFKTIGTVCIFCSFIINIYFSAISAKCIYYLALSFKYKMPWTYEYKHNNPNKIKFYQIEFFKNQMTSFQKNNESDFLNLNKFGSIDIHLLICLIILYMLYYLNYTSKHTLPKISKYLNKFLNFAPLILLLFLFFHSFSVPKGFAQGCFFFMFPKISDLLNYKIWIYSINQCIFLLMLGFGKNILFSIHQNQSDDVYHRATYTSFWASISGILSTFICCVYGGFMAEELNINNIRNLPFSFINFPLIIYPLVFGMMKFGNFWSIIFFLLMLLISIQDQQLLVEQFTQQILVLFSSIKIPEKLTIFIMYFISFFCTIPFISEYGSYFIEFFDKYISIIPLSISILLETLSVVKNIKIKFLREIIANKTEILIPNYVFFSFSLISPIFFIFYIAIGFIFLKYFNLARPIVNLVISDFLLFFPILLISLSCCYTLKYKTNSTEKNEKKWTSNLKTRPKSLEGLKNTNIFLEKNKEEDSNFKRNESEFQKCPLVHKTSKSYIEMKDLADI